MIISLIAAMDKNRLIGRENGLPWHLPADFAHFKKVTMGKPVVMGRKTYESIGKALPGRLNIVISRGGFKVGDAVVVSDIEQALDAAGNVEEVMIIGGASFYKQMIDRADRMYLTRVDAECEGDAWFPKFDENQWQVLERENHPADDKNNYSFDLITYQRKR